MNSVDPTPLSPKRALAFASGGIALAAAALLAVGTLGPGGGTSVFAQDGGSPTSTVEATETPSPTASPSVDASPSASPTSTESPSPAASPSPSPSAAASPSPSPSASPSASPSPSPSASPSPSPSPETASYVLRFRWNLLGWQGDSGTNVREALEENLSPDGDISDDVTAIYSWDSENQEWLGWFPDGESIPGANDFNTFDYGQAFWLAIDGDPDELVWTIVVRD